MSSRAIRAMRGDAAGYAFAPDADGDADDTDSDEIDDRGIKQTNVFAAVGIDDDDDDDESSTSSSRNSDDDCGATGSEDNRHGAVDSGRPQVTDRTPRSAGDAACDEEDFDALIAAFQQHDAATNDDASTNRVSSSYPCSLLLKGLDIRDMDMELSMRLALRHDSNADETDFTFNDQPAASRRRRRLFLFGRAPDNWRSPPKYIGGGIGMRTYADIRDGASSKEVPWPYSSDHQSLWFSFMYSDTFRKDYEIYQSIQDSGDVNALLWFVCQHPYHCPALLQLSSVLYQLNRSQEGLAFLRRCLWTYEASASDAFVGAYRQGSGSFLDADGMENQAFFQASFKLMQAANRAGLHRTAFAICRYILSLDPLRDPMNLLVIVDHFCMATNSVKNCEWLINMIESDTVPIMYRDSDSIATSGLLSLPNWAFSSALARLRLYQHNPSEDLRLLASAALQTAISNFPSVVVHLLQALNNIDTSVRSTSREWNLVLNFATERSKYLMHHWDQLATQTNTNTWPNTLEVMELVAQIYVQHNARLWSGDDVLDFLYSNLLRLSESVGTSTVTLPSLPSAALTRYSSVTSADYDDKIDLLPEGAVMVDEHLVIQAIAADPNHDGGVQRRRFFPANNRAAEPNHDRDLPQTQHVFGPPMQDIDPDWPLVEVFIRSFLPWNRVTRPAA